MEEVMVKVKKKLDDTLFMPISWTKGIKGGNDYPDEEVYISGTSRDELIKAILSIPELRIEDPDQSLPKDEHWWDFHQGQAYSKGQDEMLKENWVRVLKEEK